MRGSRGFSDFFFFFFSRIFFNWVRNKVWPPRSGGWVSNPGVPLRYGAVLGNGSHYGAGRGNLIKILYCFHKIMRIPMCEVVHTSLPIQPSQFGLSDLVCCQEGKTDGTDT